MSDLEYELEPTDPNLDRRMSPALLTALAVAVLIVAQLPTFLTAGVAVQIQRDLGFGTSALGAVIAGSLAASALGSIWLGRMVQKIGWAWGMRIAAIISALCMLAIASLVSGFVALLCLLLVGGLSKSLGHPAANLAIASEGSRERYGLLFGIKQAGVPATAMLAGLSVPLLAITAGWRAAFWVATGLCVVFVFVVPRGSSRGLGDPGRQRKGRSGDVHAPPLVLLAVAAGMGVAVANSIASFITTYGVEVGFSEGSAGLLLAVGSSAGIGMRIFIGWIADRRYMGLRAVSIMLAIGAAGVALLTTGSRIGVVVGTILAFGSGWGWPGLFNMAVVQRNQNAPAAATGFTQTGVYVGAGLGPLVFGFIAEESFGIAWSLFTALALAAAVVMLIGDRISFASAAPMNQI